jgi:autotransporter-associated beta strand protein
MRHRRLWAAAVGALGLGIAGRASAQTFEPNLSYAEFYHDLNDSTRGSPQVYDYSPSNQISNNTTPSFQMNGNSISNAGGGNSVGYGGLSAVTNSLDLSFQLPAGAGVTQVGNVPASPPQQPSALYLFVDLVWYLPGGFPSSPYQPIVTYQYPFGGSLSPGSSASEFAWLRFRYESTAPAEISPLETFPSSVPVTSTANLVSPAVPNGSTGLGSAVFAQTMNYAQTSGGKFNVPISGAVNFTTNAQVPSGNYFILSGYVGYQGLDPNGGVSLSLPQTSNMVKVESQLTWTGGGVTTSWSDPSNWGGAVPNGPDVIANFGTAIPSSTVVTLDNNQSVGGVIFNNSSNSYTLSSGTGNFALTIDGGVDTGILENDGGTQTISAPLILDTNLALQVTSTGSKTMLTGPISGSAGVALLGQGDALLSGNNSFTGGTSIVSGVLHIGSATALGSTTSPLNLIGGTLDLNGNALTIGALSGDGTIDNMTAGTSANFTIGSDNSSSIFNGNIASTAGGVSLMKVGTGALTLMGLDTYTGTTMIESGSLIGGIPTNGAVVNDGSLTITSSGTVGQMSGTGGLVIGTPTQPVNVVIENGPTFGSVITLSSLTVTPGSTLDLGKNAVLITYTGQSPEGQVQSYIENGSIISSFVVSNPGFGIAYADGGDSLTSDTELKPGQVVIEPDLLGDADLNGVVNIHDLQSLLGDFGQPGYWDQGNFNGHATVDISDLQVLLTNFNATFETDYADVANIQSLVGEFGDVAVLNSDGTGFTLVAVPEPASVGLALAALAGILLRRRRPHTA